LGDRETGGLGDWETDNVLTLFTIHYPLSTKNKYLSEIYQ
jgi:hypothetical protein